MPSLGVTVTPVRRVARRLFAEDDTDVIKESKCAVEETLNKIYEEERLRAIQTYNFDTEHGPVDGERYNWVAMRGASVPAPYIHKPRDLYPKCTNPVWKDIYALHPKLRQADDSLQTDAAQPAESSQDGLSFTNLLNEKTPRKVRLRQTKVTESMKISKPKRSLVSEKRKRPTDMSTDDRLSKQTRMMSLS